MTEKFAPEKSETKKSPFNLKIIWKMFDVKNVVGSTFRLSILFARIHPIHFPVTGA